MLRGIWAKSLKSQSPAFDVGDGKPRRVAYVMGWRREFFWQGCLRHDYWILSILCKANSFPWW
jgi:hypothetical protein